MKNNTYIILTLLFMCSTIPYTYAETSHQSFGEEELFTMLADKNVKKGVKAFKKKKFEKSKKYWLKASQDNNPMADNLLGYLYEQSSFEDHSTYKSRQWFKKAADQGLAEAQYKLGSSYIYTDNKSQDVNKGIYWLKKAADNNYAQAQATLGEIYEKGKYTTQSYSKAAKWYAKSAKEIPYADTRINYLYDNGLIARPNKKGASYWNSSEAVKRYKDITGSQIYKEAKIALKEKNYPKAQFLFKTSANKGDTNSQLFMGYMYETGINSTQSYEQAFHWYSLAAQNGHAIAQSYLANLYLKGLGVIRSYPQAFAWYKKAASAGVINALMKTAKMYEQGLGVTQSYTEARGYYKQAADKGNAEAQYKVGYMYENGLGMMNKARWIAKAWYLMSSKQGYEKGTENYKRLVAHEANIYQNGMSAFTYGNTQAALGYLDESAQLGYLPAQLKLAEVYYEGKLVNQDFYKAYMLYEEAAKQGDSEAQYMMGIMHQYGQFISKSNAIANEYYKKAINQGHEKALAQFNQLNRQTPSQPHYGWKDFHRERDAARRKYDNCQKYAHFTPNGKYGYDGGYGFGSDNWTECPIN